MRDAMANQTNPTNPTNPNATPTGGAGPTIPAANPAAGKFAGTPKNPAPAAAPIHAPPAAIAPVGPSGFTPEQDALLARKMGDLAFVEAAARLAEQEAAKLEELALKVTARNAVADRCKQAGGAGGYLTKVVGTLLSIAVIGCIFFTPEGQLFAYDRLVDFKNAVEDVTGNIKVGYSGRPEVREVTVKRGEIVKVSIAPGVAYNAVWSGQVYFQTQAWLPHQVRGHENLGETDFLALSGEGVVKFTTR